MKITILKEKFHKEWVPTGNMIKEFKTLFVQTYQHPRFKGIYRQNGYEQTPFGEMIVMETIEPREKPIEDVRVDLDKLRR